ncbi:Gfo/Idh/MocA family oxidoreductase [Mangrovimicrobium sediminis]|uniref:Gfo/Idh/MocA family oxidoreductase n=1 Tax=Mangrovimicrobium sediminis TaxID=2562682 RepID=A0A4Z0LVM8_9GAMM|nr:Gfo/Idh/MocA family oxidoreductase [Haliea sp. SAOS-164]TGD71115.1 Gfo/Idh/MocA family oxidoreductase [Haliea sp. SAOS-164]
MTESGGGPRVIIAGSGHGCRVHLPALRETGFEVVGLLGTDAGRTARRAERHGIPAAFTDIDAAIRATGAKAVTVASLPNSHAEVVRGALRHGCHVVCEKPFTRDAAEARELFDAAHQAGVVHFMGNQLRAMPDRRAGARAIAEGLIGEPRYLSFLQHADLLADTDRPWPDWWFDSDAGGGWLGASGSHMIDHVRDWLGEFDVLSAALPLVADRKSVAEDSFTVRFRLASGVQGMITQTAADWGPMTSVTKVVGSHGTLWLENGTAWLADRDGVRQLPVPEEDRLVPMQPSEDPRQRYLHVELPPTLKLFAAWHAAIEGRSGDHPFATFADGLAAMQVIDAVRASARADGASVAVQRG